MKEKTSSIKDRINDKIRLVDENLSELLEIIPDNFERYKNNNEKKAACERYFERVIEAVVDVAHLIIKKQRFDIPEGDEEAFYAIYKAGIISKELAEKFSDAKGMRNILAHKYGEIDDSKVFYALSEEIEMDVRDFIKQIDKYLKKKTF